MQSVTEHLANQVGLHSRPDVLILSSVAFVGPNENFEQGAKDWVANAQSLATLVRRPYGASRASPDLVFATTPSHRNHSFTAAILPRLPPEWRILDRDTELNRLVGRSGKQGIRLSTSHLPHLNNFYDLQRLVHGLVRSEQGSEQAPATCIRHKPVNFSKDCAGHVVGSRFIESVHHH